MAVVSTVMNIRISYNTEFLNKLRGAALHSGKTCVARPTLKPPTGTGFIMDLLCQAFVATCKKKRAFLDYHSR